LIIQAARHKAIDRIRRDQRLREIVERDAPDWQFGAEDPIQAAETIPDDRLRLIFTCCHPALAAAALGSDGSAGFDAAARRTARRATG
jgi:RNA polymerase sigma-70 factor (ECF subfamily)